MEIYCDIKNLHIGVKTQSLIGLKHRPATSLGASCKCQIGPLLPSELLLFFMAWIQ